MRSLVLLTTLSVLAPGSPQDFGELVGMHVGCFMDNPQSPDLQQRLPGLLNTVALCTQACKIKYFKYAGKGKL